MKKLHACAVCGAYTLSPTHCGRATRSAHPPRFDPNDRYGDYRRRWKGIA
jgi:H/ACA ribonucleoprotein complex subunit 3